MYRYVTAATAMTRISIKATPKSPHSGLTLNIAKYLAS
jgi:hypothetical protein